MGQHLFQLQDGLIFALFYNVLKDCAGHGPVTGKPLSLTVREPTKTGRCTFYLQFPFLGVSET